MADKKPTYEELQRRVEELEREVLNARAASSLGLDEQARMAMLERIMDQVGEGIAVAGLDGAVRFCNRRFAEMHQYRPEELLGRNLSMFHTPEQLERDVIPFNNLALQNGQHSGEVGHVRRDGVEFPAWMNTTLLRDEQGRPAGFIGVMSDISRVKAAEDDLKRTELELRSVLDSMVEHVVYHDTDLRILWANQAAADSAGVSPQSLVGLRCHEVWHDSPAPCGNCPVLRAMQTGTPHHQEITSPDGRHWFIRGYPIMSGEGAVQGVVEFTLEITDRKATERALLASEQFYRSTIDWMDDIVHVVDQDLNIILHNKRMQEFNRELGLPQDIAGKRLTEIYPFLTESVIEQYASVFRHGEILITEEQNDFDGRTVVTETRKIPVMDKGLVTRVITMARDITDRKSAEQELADSEREKAEVLNSMMEHVLYYDTNLNIVWANRAAADSVGMRPRDLTGRNCHQLWYGTDEPCRECPVLKALESGQPVEDEITTPDGKVWSIRSSPIRDERGRIAGAVETALEITDRKRAEQALEQERATLDSIIDYNPYSICIFDGDGNFVRCNQALAELFGAPTPRDYNLFQDPILIEAGHVDAVRSLKAGEAFLEAGVWYDASKVHPDGPAKKVCVRAVTFPICGASGRIQNFVVMHEDITQRRLMEDALRQSEERYRNLFNSHPETIIVMDLEGRVTDINKAGFAATGFTREQIIGKHFTEFNAIEERHLPRYSEMFTRLITGEDMGRVEIELTIPDGTQRWIEVYPSRIMKGNELAGFQMLTIDITERKTAERALRQSEERYRNLAESAKDAIFIIDKDFRVEYVNEFAAGMFASTPEQLFRIPLERLFPKENYASMRSDLETVFRTGQALYAESQTRFGDTVLWLGTQLSPLHDDAGGAVNAVLGVSRDITERKIAEEALRETKDRLEATLNALPDMLFEIDPEGVFLNYHATSDSGLYAPPQQFIGKSIGEILPGDVAEILMAANRTVQETGQTASTEYELPLPEGMRTFEAIFSPKGRRGEPGFGCIALVRDITERKAAEQAVRQALDRFEAVIENTPLIAVQGFKRDGTIHLWNNASESLYGYSSSEAVGRKIQELLLDDESSAVFLETLEEIWTSGQATLPSEWPVHTRTGEERWVYSTMFPLFRGGEVSEIICMDLDITERRKLDQAKINFLGSISHELRTPLSLILGYSEMLLRENLPHNVRKKLKIINERGRQELKLVEELITLAQFESGETKFQMADVPLWEFLEGYLGEARVMLDSLVSKRCRDGRFTFDKHLDPALKGAVVHCDSERIRQVLDNLLENAVKYSPSHRLEFRFTADLRDGHAVIAVHDSGVGIDPSEIDNIFKPFYQLRQGRHPLSDGMGKGLSIVKEFIEAHKGRVRVESEPGRGSVFQVFLPVKEMREHRETLAVRSILLVDDDPDFLDFVESLLFSEGYDVLAAPDCDSAMKILERITPDLALLDMNLPGCTGQEMCERIRSNPAWAGMFVYLVSAKSQDELSAISRVAGANGFFSKPFEIDAFLDTIASLTG